MTSLRPELDFCLPYGIKKIAGTDYPVIPDLLSMFEWVIWSTEKLVPADYPKRYLTWKEA